MHLPRDIVINLRATRHRRRGPNVCKEPTIYFRDERECDSGAGWRILRINQHEKLVLKSVIFLDGSNFIRTGHVAGFKFKVQSVSFRIMKLIEKGDTRKAVSVLDNNAVRSN